MEPTNTELWWLWPVITILRRLKQKDYLEFEISLDNIVKPSPRLLRPPF